MPALGVTGRPSALFPVSGGAQQQQQQQQQQSEFSLLATSEGPVAAANPAPTSSPKASTPAPSTAPAAGASKPTTPATKQQQQAAAVTDAQKTGAAADGYVVDNTAAAYPVFADPATVAEVFGDPSGDSEWESLKPATDAAAAAEEPTVFASGFRFVDPDPNHLYDPVPEDDADDVTLQQDYYAGSANYGSRSYEEEPSSSRYYAPAAEPEPEYSEQDEYKQYSSYEAEEDDNVMKVSRKE
jgi:hypothetical protein